MTMTFPLVPHKRRLAPEDHFFDEGNVARDEAAKVPVEVIETVEREVLPVRVPVFSCDAFGCTLHFSTVEEYEAHYER